jgi:hypothetical protein
MANFCTVYFDDVALATPLMQNSTPWVGFEVASLGARRPDRDGRDADRRSCDEKPAEIALFSGY